MKVGPIFVEQHRDEFGDYNLTILPDNTWVLARTDDRTPDFKDVVQHEWLHSWLWWCLFEEPSYTMWKLAHPHEEWDHNLIAYEEAAVLRIERYLKEGT